MNQDTRSVIQSSLADLTGGVRRCLKLSLEDFHDIALILVSLDRIAAALSADRISEIETADTKWNSARLIACRKCGDPVWITDESPHECKCLPEDIWNVETIETVEKRWNSKKGRDER